MAVDDPSVARYLPPLPERGCGDGYDWMEEAAPAWSALAGWGAHGWDLGDWPYVIVVVCAVKLPAAEALRTGARHVLGVATYVEGDLDVHAYTTRHDFMVAVDEIAAFYWRLSANDGPPDLPPIGPVRVEHSGPYSPSRAELTAQ